MTSGSRDSVNYTVEEEPPPPLAIIAARIPTGYRVGTVIRLDDGPYAGRRLKLCDDQRDGKYWEVL